MPARCRHLWRHPDLRTGIFPDGAPRQAAALVYLGGGRHPAHRSGWYEPAAQPAALEFPFIPGKHAFPAVTNRVLIRLHHRLVRFAAGGDHHGGDPEVHGREVSPGRLAAGGGLIECPSTNRRPCATSPSSHWTLPESL